MKYLLVLCLLASCLCSTAQIEIQKKGFYQGGRLLTPKELVSIMENNSAALTLATKAKSNYGAANALGFVGGFLIGWPIGTAIGGGEPEWALLGVGAGITAIAIPIMSSAKKKMTEAVTIYNDGLESTSSIRLDFKVTGNGVGLVFKF